MSTLALALAGRFTRGWAQTYTEGLPTHIRAERKEEIASDLWEQASEGGAEGESANAIAAHTFGRAVLGMPADVAWHLGELKGDEMQLSISQKSIVGIFILLGLATIIFGVMLSINGIDQGWLFHNPGETFEGLLLIAFTAGPLVAFAGVYAVRRAVSEGRSTNRARAIIVVGTLCIAGLGAWMYWTLVGPIIAVGIVAYWINKIGQWRSGPPRAA